MRVAIISFSAGAGDAVGNQVAEKLAFFLERGADVRVFAESEHNLHPAVRPHCAKVDPADPHGADWEFLTSADLVIVEFSRSGKLLNLLPLLAASKARVLFAYHGLTPLAWWGHRQRASLADGLAQRGLVWCADAAFTHSRFTRRELLEATGFPSERCHTLGLPIDTQFFCPGPPAVHLRQRLGLGPATLLLFVGRVAPNKRVSVLVEALNQLRTETPPVHGVVIGDTGDVYDEEVRLCKQRAGELGVAQRLHFLGHVSAEDLRDAYRSADVFVMPSRHEGFCVPVVEAMACGLPVVAARAGALPETLGRAGLSFIPDDAVDLARQVRRVLASASSGGFAPRQQRLRAAVAVYRFGREFAGGAETSLRTMANALHQAGHEVEIFTTCTRTESQWTDQLPEGTITEDNLPIHRFRIDSYDARRYRDSVRRIHEGGEPVPDEVEREFLDHSLHSTRLVEALGRRISAFDAVITGPYLSGVTFDIARRFPDKTLLVPCFHDEPLARLRLWLPTYERVAGILFHSEEEQQLVEAGFGLNVPGGICAGTHLPVEEPGNASHGRDAVGTGRRYVVYCGRYVHQKGLPLLLDYARQYGTRHPERFTFAFLGQGEVAIPREPWARDLGFVGEAAKRDILAGAAALVLLSRHESLSLVALEAWAQGTPVLADAGCAVVCGHLERCGGGRTVASSEGLAGALDDLWRSPEQWQQRGGRGREYVRNHYGSQSAFTQTLEQAIREMKVPLAERMRGRGLARVAALSRPAWREGFGRLIEDLLDRPARPRREQILVEPRSPVRTVAAGEQTILVPVRVTNQGTLTAVVDGPGRTVLRSEVAAEDGGPETALPGQRCETALPGLLMPGRTLAAAMRVAVPFAPGVYRVIFSAERACSTEAGRTSAVLFGACHSYRDAPMRLVVENSRNPGADRWYGPLLDAAQAALVEAQHLQKLPDDYTDVTQGRFAQWKRWIKAKLLGNFKHAYVDVLSRQQSAFNQRVLAALVELAECCALLADARSQIQESDRRCQALEERLARLEEKLQTGVGHDPSVMSSQYLSGDSVLTGTGAAELPLAETAELVREQ